MTDSTVHVSKAQFGEVWHFFWSHIYSSFLEDTASDNKKKKKKHGRVLYVHVAHCIVIVIRN